MTATTTSPQEIDMSTPTPEMIQTLRAAADEHVAECADLSVACAALAERDRDDLNAIADAIASGDLESAWSTINTLDTLPRELIAPALWVAIGGKLVQS